MDPTGGGRELAGEDGQQRGLPGTVGAGDHQPRSGLDVHADRVRQATGNLDVVGADQHDTRAARQGRHVWAQRRLRGTDLVAPQFLLAAVHRAHHSRGPGGALVFPGAFVRPPAGPQPVLRLGQVLGQASVLGLLLLELGLPPRELGAAPGLVAGEPVAVDARAAVPTGIEGEDGRGDVGQQRPVVADHDQSAKVHQRDAWVMVMVTARQMIDSVVRSVCGHDVVGVVPLTGGGINETYRVELSNDVPVVARIARQAVPWFTDESQIMARARAVGVPTPQVLGVEQLHHDGEVLSLSIQRFVPGRSLDELVHELPATDLQRLVMNAGELLARVHGIVPDRGLRHELRLPEERVVARVARIVHEALGPAAAAVVERGADVLREKLMTRPSPPVRLAHGDFLPKNLLVEDGAIVGVIDWEFAGPASPAFDLARWEVSAGDPLHDRVHLLRRGYARVADSDTADAGLTSAFAIDWALEVLGWKNPAPPAQVRRCVDVIARHAAP